jgi:hypothetical protein
MGLAKRSFLLPAEGTFPLFEFLDGVMWPCQDAADLAGDVLTGETAALIG